MSLLNYVQHSCAKVLHLTLWHICPLERPWPNDHCVADERIGISPSRGPIISAKQANVGIQVQESLDVSVWDPAVFDREY